KEPAVQAYATTSGDRVARRRAACRTSAFIARSASGVVVSMKTRAAWNEMRGGAIHANSGSVVVFTDGMIRPTLEPSRRGLASAFISETHRAKTVNAVDQEHNEHREGQGYR